MTFDLTGGLTIRGEATFEDVGTACVADGDGRHFNAIQGVQVSVFDKSGEMVGIGVLDPGRRVASDAGMGLTDCRFPFLVEQIPVMPDATFVLKILPRLATLEFTQDQAADLEVTRN